MVNLEGAGIKRLPPPVAQDAFERVWLVGLIVQSYMPYSIGLSLDAEGIKYYNA